MDKNWMVIEPEKKLVLIYKFDYFKDNNGPIYDYDERFAEFAEQNGIRADKIMSIRREADGTEYVHVYVDNGHIEQYALVRFRPPAGFEDKCQFKDGQVFVYLGEIPNMRGHCVVADRETGMIHAGYHAENFEVINNI